MSTDFKEEFQRLWDSKNPEKRGIAFEELFCRLLFKSGFVVHKDPASANPRQTDVLAEFGDDVFLFEMKWLGRKVGIEAIAQIKDRLGRASKGTIGCICSASGFTESLIRDVEQHRAEFEILLFNPYEIYGMFVHEISIVDLIDDKRRGLRRDGAMWFYEQSPRHSKSRYVELPPSHESLHLPASSIHFRLESQHLSDILFARTHLIFDEYLWAVSLRVRLNCSSVEDLREVFIAAENKLGLRGTGAFGIRQRSAGWYGLGSDCFLKEIALLDQRYEHYKGHTHHSEELAFFDELNGGGLFLLSARQSLTRKHWIHSGEIIVRLPGVPANPEPYNKFVRSITSDNLVFSPEQPLRRKHTELRSSVRIELQDVITSIGSKELKREEGCVSGVVLKNPFFRNPARIAELSNDKELLAYSEPEYLICTLDDWLDEGDEVDYYVLTALETVALGEAVLLHPSCTWGNLTKRAHPPDESGFRKIEAEWKHEDGVVERIKRASQRKRDRT